MRGEKTKYPNAENLRQNTMLFLFVLYEPARYAKD
jgi:hypothetical protein